MDSGTVKLVVHCDFGGKGTQHHKTLHKCQISCGVCDVAA